MTDIDFRIKNSWDNNEDFYLSDMIYPQRNQIHLSLHIAFSHRANGLMLSFLEDLYQVNFADYGSIWLFFNDYLKRNYIHPVEVLAMQDEIIKFTDSDIKNLTRQFARLERVKLIDNKSDDFNFKKHKLYKVGILTVGIDKIYNLAKIEEFLKFADFSIVEVKKHFAKAENI